MEELIGLHSKAIERLALQYGCTGEQAASVSERTFSTYQTRLVAIESEEAITDLYKIAIELLKGIKLEILPDNFFLFKEDAEIHMAIVQLPSEDRVTFILSKFQKLSIEQIEIIMECTAIEADVRLATAKQVLRNAIGEFDEMRLEKRLQFLEKSLNRLPLQFNINQVTKTERTLTEPIVKKSRKGLIKAAILGIVFIGLIVGTYIAMDLRSDTHYIEKMKNNYDKEKREKVEMLGGNVELLNAMPFIEEVDSQFRPLIGELEKTIEAGTEIDRNYAAKRYASIIEAMALPSELAADLFKNPLVDDVDKSMVFAKKYIERLEVVGYTLYEEITPEVENFIESTGGHYENFDTELFLSSSKDFDESARNAMTALEDQGLPPLYFLQSTELNTKNRELVGRIRNSLHPLAGGYLLATEKEPFTIDEKLVYSIDETIGFIEKMEETMRVDKVGNGQGYSLDGMIAHLLEAIITGKGEEALRDDNGIISEMYQEAWKRLAALNKDSPTSQVTTKVVDEMEASGWKESAFYSAIDNYRIHEAYSFARNGVLEEFGLNPDLQLDEMYDERMAVTNSMDEETAGLYAEFSVDYDREILQYEHPLLILSLFYYANEKEDALMMWHLMDEQERAPESDAYVQGWQKRTPLLLETDSVYFDPNLLMGTDEKRLVPIEFTREKRATYDIWMTYADDNIWQIQRIVNED